MRQTFDNVYVASDIYDHIRRCTFVVIGTRRSIDFDTILQPLKLEYPIWVLNSQEIDELIDKAGHTVLSDDYAPVENLLAPVLRASSAYQLCQSYSQNAQLLLSENRWRESIEEYKRAARTYPKELVEPYRRAAEILLAHDLPAEALEICTGALRQNEQVEPHLDPSPLHLNMAISLRAMNRTAEAESYFKSAIDGFRRELGRAPGSPQRNAALGIALTAIAAYDEAVVYLRRAIQLDDANGEYRYMLAWALTSQEKYDEAVVAINEGIEAVSHTGDQRSLKQLQELLRHAQRRQAQR
jgi:tetratricopeptide (TPR) repeat protein